MFLVGIILHIRNMDSINEYRKLAKERHLQYVNEQKAIADKRIADELKIKEELESIELFFTNLDVSITSLETTTDIELDLQIFQSSIESFIGILKSNNRLNELRTKITILVQILNKLHASKTKSSSYVGTIKKIVQEIFTICEVNIPIEPMDTSEDDEYARKLQEDYYNLPLSDDEM
jgi:hypothetical protein